MSSSKWPVYSPLAREHFGKGLKQGHEQGIEQGRTQGVGEGTARAVITILTDRGIHIPDTARQRITTCDDQTQLDTWLHRSLTATTTNDLFTNN
ncbi:hypothetical protein [Spongiactinospora sp. TRM90649]|uniref:hypothetical protein n=1 Tax=Spongiactinospora sp. TRM90649 TaxID=3031114 RepID=UPI0023F8B1FE|nr:hypothetical protein [Spongiactinospora sp. TRM90649]MDF5757474.1 hypothetical protein [Spongiactinospora sp. TRM90649]